jgi:branched-chain amino acid transport system permease protein
MLPSMRNTTGALALGAGMLLLRPLAGLDPFLLDVLTSGFLLASYVGSWDIVGGVAGQISLGHALFFGAATYSCALLTSLAGWPFAAAGVAALLLSTGAAAVVGTMSARLKGPFIALLTLALGELSHEVMIGQTFFSPRGAYSWGGEGGVPVALPWDAPSPWAAYYGALLFLFVSAWGMRRIALSREGLVWTAISGSELTARASGVDVARHKRRAFAAAGLFAGAAGVGFAAYVGRATVVGPVLAALILHTVFRGAGVSPAARVLLYALALLLVLRFFPAGVAGALRQRIRARKMISGGAIR